MNILLVTETYLPYITGVSVSTDSIARYMVSQGHKVTIVCPKQLAKGVVTALEGLRIINVPNIPFTFGNQNVMGLFPTGITIIEKLARENKFDIVHIQEPTPTGISALIVAKKHKIPTVGALHFIPEQTDRNLLGGKAEKILTLLLGCYIKFIYNKYDKIMTVSNFFAGNLKKYGVIKPITVISNGTDIDEFHPASIDLALRKRLGVSDDSVVFFYLGRLDGDKNVETLIRAMPFVNLNVKLLIVGKGKKKEELQKLAIDLKVDSKIIWVNYITDEEMPDYYHAANVFSIMSPYEGQSIVTLQAVASGLPIIAANAGALPELCFDGKNGFLVNTYDFKTLADRINKLAGDKELREQFGVESRKIALPHHKPTVLHKLELLYLKIRLQGFGL
jgi:1,2-diacylglycerol 3-alpha-glucosyltransferase